MFSLIDRTTFIGVMELAEEENSESHHAMSEFWDWMYENEEGSVQVCAFYTPTDSNEDDVDADSKYDHVDTYEGFKKFCVNHSGVWRYQVYAGVNTLAETPEYGRGKVSSIDTVNTVSLDLEVKREPYQGATKEEVYYTYRYAMAQVEYIWNKLNTLPMVVMSENGIHLHYKADLDVNEDMLVGKQHIVSKAVTQAAMNCDRAKQVEERFSDDVTFDQDDVSDVPRVMKVPGTLGVKSDKGRVCGIIHTPDPENVEPITEEPFNLEVIKKDFSSDEQKQDKTMSVKPDSDSIDSSIKERVESLCKDDSVFRQMWNGSIAHYDSRSEAEYAFVLKLLSRGFEPQEVWYVMNASGMAKWDEEEDHYRERTIKNAMDNFDGEQVKDRHSGSLSFSKVS